MSHRGIYRPVSQQLALHTHHTCLPVCVRGHRKRRVGMFGNCQLINYLAAFSGHQQPQNILIRASRLNWLLCSLSFLLPPLSCCSCKQHDLIDCLISLGRVSVCVSLFVEGEPTNNTTCVSVCCNHKHDHQSNAILIIN